LSIGVGVNWVSPFGPLRIDLAKALLKQKGDQPKLFSFNVGTSF
jgi:outer membrane protein insertion porin family